MTGFVEHLRDRRVLLVVLLVAAFVRFWGAFEYSDYYIDEAILVPAAVSLGQHGTTTNMVWAHPPFGGLMVAGTIGLFGNNPVGWRIGSVLLGIATVMLVYLVARRIFPDDSHAPLLAASLLALDPFHALFSRTAYAEIPLVFFFLLYLYFMLEYSEKGRYCLPLAGIALGLTIATKNNYVAAALLVAGYSFCRARQRGANISLVLVDFSLALVLLPASVYLLSYSVWFGRGYSLAEFFHMRSDAFYFLKNLSPSSFITTELLDLGGTPREWFLKPSLFGHQTGRYDDMGVFRLEINNWPIRILVLPSVGWALYYAWKNREIRESLAPVLFLACYLLVLVLNRPIFSHSALVTLPFAYLSVAWAIERLTSYCGRRQVTMLWCVLSILASWGLYTFPLYASRPVPLWLYGPILNMARFTGVSP